MKKPISSELTKPIPDCQTFLKKCNDNMRVRKFNELNYDEFLEHIKVARKKANWLKPYYVERTGGGVTKAYMKYNRRAYTAHYAVWTLGNQVHFDFKNSALNQNGDPACIYFGGKQSYRHDHKNNKNPIPLELSKEDLELIQIWKGKTTIGQTN